MSDGRRARPPERVGIRELRQNLSVYVKRIQEEGRAYEVTERGRSVARLLPLEDRPMSRYERMVAEGGITSAKGDLRSLPEPLPAPPGIPLSQVIIEMRDEERW